MAAEAAHVVVVVVVVFSDPLSVLIGEIVGVKRSTF